MSEVLLLQQFGFAGVLIFYMVMLTLATCGAVCDDKVAFNVILARLTQGCFLIVFASSYYRLVWTPTMLDEMPQVQEFFSKNSASMVPYGLAMTGFSGNLWCSAFQDDIETQWLKRRNTSETVFNTSIFIYFDLC